MKTINKIILLAILTLFLSSCQRLSIDSSKGLFGQPTETVVTSTQSPTPTKTPTQSPTPTEVPFLEKSPDQQVEIYLTNPTEVNTGDFNSDQLSKFSEALTGKLIQEREARPAIYNNEAYLDPDSSRMRHLDDGRSHMDQTFQLFLPLTKDSEGNLSIKNPQGEWVTIKGSKDVDWNMIVTSLDDPRINWPPVKAGEKYHCVSIGDPIRYFSSEYKEAYPERTVAQIPVILLDKTMGEMYLGNWMSSFFRILTINTDSYGNPIYARESITTWFRFCLMEEGSTGQFSDFPYNPSQLMDYLANPANKRLIETWNHFETNQIYYLGIPSWQINDERSNIYPDLTGWTGVADMQDVYQILTKQKVNNDDLVVFFNWNFIKKVDP